MTFFVTEPRAIPVLVKWDSIFTDSCWSVRFSCCTWSCLLFNCIESRLTNSHTSNFFSGKSKLTYSLEIIFPFLLFSFHYSIMHMKSVLQGLSHESWTFNIRDRLTGRKQNSDFLYTYLGTIWNKLEKLLTLVSQKNEQTSKVTLCSVLALVYFKLSRPRKEFKLHKRTLTSHELARRRRRQDS